MIKKFIKGICLMVILLTWVALVIVELKIEDEVSKICVMVGIISLSYMCVRLYSYIEMYQECERLYCLTKENNRKILKSWYNGDTDKTQDYIELMQINGDGFLEMKEQIIKTFPLLPKKKLSRMSQVICHMMKREYPPI